MKNWFFKIFRIPVEMTEMASVFHMPASARWRYIYLPAIFGKRDEAEE